MSPTDAVRLAHAHLRAGRFAEALAEAAPVRHAPAGALLHALALAGTGRAAEAAPLLAAIAAANPGHRHPVLDLLPLLPAAAGVEHLRQAAALRPHDPALPAALGAALAEIGPMGEAIEAFATGTTLAPGDASGWSNLGKALAAAARFDEAEAAFATARGLAPGDLQIAHNHALATLKSGRLQAGWRALGVRHGLPGRPPPLPGPRLTTLDVAGRTVLLRHEEGFGDTLHFVRYAAPLAARGARVIVAVPAPLRRIVSTATGVAEAVGLEDRPAYDVWAPLLDVPGLFDDVPAFAPYLRAEGSGPALPPGRRIGVAWAGDPRHKQDRQRSIPLPALTPLAARRDVAWISLQKGGAAPGWMHDPMGTVADFADTASIVAQLDAVVSVDTAVAHLAGAMGKPVLLLDRYDGCWRWLTGRTDSPWYPTLRLLRQPAPGDWAGAVAALLDALPVSGMP